MEDFSWNPYADQPHNIAPKKDRWRLHLKYAGSYLSLLPSNLAKLSPSLFLYWKYRQELYTKTVFLEDCFAVSVSMEETREKTKRIISSLKELGVAHTLFRLPSWEKEKMERFLELAEILDGEGFSLTLALLQCRRDVLDSGRWKEFLEEVFYRFKGLVSFFEIGHAWNRTKWGLWSWKEYLKLMEPASELSSRKGVKLVGPAVIDFEFHLYPPLLSRYSFDKVSSLLYVDRGGAPENTQFGWDTSRKVALLKAIVDSCRGGPKDLWVTEVNWPLRGTGPYSPASGKPNVSEEEQANYLVRYYVLTLATGLVERVYWWQLAAPGYGLVDNRGDGWRKRPSYLALKTLIDLLKDSRFLKKIPHPEAYIFVFSKNDHILAVAWRKAGGGKVDFPFEVKQIVTRDGQVKPARFRKIFIDTSPCYLILKEEEKIL